MPRSFEDNCISAMRALAHDERFTEMWQVHDFVRAVVTDERDADEAIENLRS